MPQYTHHDFYLNFTASLKAGDLDLSRDVLANEVSDFIVFGTDKIIKAFNQSDIKVDKNSTDEEIVDLFISNISTNKNLSLKMAFIIAEGNELLINDKGNKDKQLKTISTISNGIKEVAKDIANNSKEFKEATMNQVVSKASKRQEYNRVIWNKDKKGISVGKVLLIGIGVFAIGCVIIYYRQRSSISQALPNMIMGGNTGDVSMQNPTPPIQTPIQTALVVPAAVEPIPLMPEPIQTAPIQTH